MHVDDEDKTTALIQGAGSNYKSQTTIINGSGLYSLILSSKLPQAKEFKRWVTSVALPQIRKTGGYIPVSEEDDEKTILIRNLAKLITQNGVKIGQTRFFYWLRLNGYLFKKKAGRRPIQKWVEMDKRL
ncbi:MAG: BRO family protein [Prevotellaceae bacterium]|nr:BRO family protein [Prevotellaceae bacterium]